MCFPSIALLCWSYRFVCPTLYSTALWVAKPKLLATPPLTCLHVMIDSELGDLNMGTVGSQYFRTVSLHSLFNYIKVTPKLKLSPSDEGLVSFWCTTSSGSSSSSGSSGSSGSSSSSGSGGSSSSSSSDPTETWQRYQLTWKLSGTKCETGILLLMLRNSLWLCMPFSYVICNMCAVHRSH